MVAIVAVQTVNLERLEVDVLLADQLLDDGLGDQTEAFFVGSAVAVGEELGTVGGGGNVEGSDHAGGAWHRDGEVLE